MKLLLVLFALCAVAHCMEVKDVRRMGNSGGTMEMRYKLRKRIFEEYDRHNSPDNIKCKIGVNLLNILPDVEKECVTADIWLKLMWKDTRLTWDRTKTNVDLLRVGTDEIWKPDIVPYNSVDFEDLRKCWKSKPIVYHTGEVLWILPCHVKVHCNMTLKDHPFEDQRCKLKFGSWVYDKEMMDLEFLDNRKDIDLDFFQTSKYKILSSKGVKHERIYPGLKTPFVDITFDFILKKVTRKEMCMRHDIEKNRFDAEPDRRHED